MKMFKKSIMIIAGSRPGGKVIPPDTEVARMITFGELLQLAQVIISIVNLWLTHKKK